MENEEMKSASANASVDQRKETQGTSKSKKKLTKGNIILIAIILIVVWFIGIQLMAGESYSMLVQVVPEEDGESQMGINPLTENLDFGDLSENVGASRYLSLKNESNKDRFILVWKRGEISDMVDLNKNGFTLVPGSEEKLEFHILIPPSAEMRYYYGKARIFMWPKLW
ncbi:hypothetical protein KKA15_02190 [Patescibacteria group bacterium]|nr:hypothetical protein [Patescibacteria group bacterium]